MTEKPRKRGARRRLIAIAALVAGVAAVWLGLHWSERRPLARNLVVVLVDTLRADHLSLYGYSRPTSPRLDALAAAQGVVFENVRAQAPCTFPSINSLLTSRSPLRFIRESEQEFGIPDDVPSLATVLAGSGFATAAVSASPIFRATPSAENPDAGFGAGFDLFDETCYWQSAGCVNGRVVTAVEGLREPFLVYAHYLDPHDPYLVPKRFESRFAGPPPDSPGRESLAAGDPNPAAVRLYDQGLDAGLSNEELSYLVDRYDDEIAYWDEQFGVLIWALSKRGLLERTVIAVVADHGEQFLEHEHLKHCRTLYDVELRVPFVFFVPGVKARRVATPVANLDLAPTLLDLVGVRHAEAGFEGRSLRREITGRRPPRGAPAPVQRAWWNGERAVSDDRHKLVVSPAWSTPRLFDLVADPGERSNLAHTDRDAVSRLRRPLAEWVRDEPYVSGADEVTKRLKSLGYLQ